MKFVEIDGSILEGGGQILRIAVSLSCILNQPVRITNIRASRPKPGLAAQHLTGLELVKRMCSGFASGFSFGSTEIEFTPKFIRGGRYEADIGTAGSIALLLQIALPVALFSNKPSTLDLKGGTNAVLAPQIDFITEVFRRNLEKFGATFDFDLFKRGYFPRGGGHVQVKVQPVKKLDPILCTSFGRLEKVYGWSFVSGFIPERVSQDIANGAKSVIKDAASNVPIDIEAYKESLDIATDNCSGIIVVGETDTKCVIGGSAVGSRREKPIETGRKAGVELETSIKAKACVDEFVQDQLILYMALASDVSRIRTIEPTLHTKTAIHVCELMTKAKFKTIPHEDGTHTIECTGIGFVNSARV